jgi:FkbM family methyltransferase
MTIARVRAFLRSGVDRAFCRSVPGKETVGTADHWTLITQALPTRPVVFSAGVGRDMTFELDMARRFGATVHMFDPSQTGRETASRAENQRELVHFHAIGWAGLDGDVPFHPAGADGSLSKPEGECTGERLPCRRVPTLMRDLGIAKLDLLKMDIEGFEYEVLDDILAARVPVDQICLEFHHFLPGIPYSRTLSSILALWRAGYVLIHKTRCDYTFARRALVG